MSLLPSSARQRRRLLRLGILLGVAGVIALLVAFVPRGKVHPPVFSTQPVQTVKSQRTVPLTAADRSAIDRTLDRFVPAAVGRRHPLRAWALAASDLRRGTTRAEWARGDLPVQPYPVRSGPTHSWVLLYSFPNLVDLELGLRPQPGAKIGNAAFFVKMKRERGAWRVASFALHTVY